MLTRTLKHSNTLTLLLLSQFLCFSALAASDGKTYALEACDAVRSVMLNSAADQTSVAAKWADENLSAEGATPGAAFGVVGKRTASPSPSDEKLVKPESARANVMERGGVSKYRLASARVGRGVTRVRTDFSLGDQLVAPADLGEIDWAATYRNSAAIAGQQDVFFFSGSGDLSDAAIYFACGGATVTVVWTLTDGTTSTRSYSVSETSSSRPFRLYRTDAPYNNSPVDLSGKFVKVVGSPSLFTLEYGTNSTVNADGSTSVNTNAVVRGVYLSGDNSLYAVGDVKGQFLVAYYDSADYTRVLSVQVVEVCTPSVKTVSAVVGEELKPQADGYVIKGLYPQVVTSSRTTYDRRGDFIYVHSGSDSFSPHRNSAFALRPTMDEDDAKDHTWDATINWYAPDELGTEWPFEQTQYSIRWGEGVTHLISGDAANPGQSPVFPDGWTATTCDYQSPDGHLVDGTWKKEGRSLFKITGPNADGFDDVAFVQVDAVLASSVAAATTTNAVGKLVAPSDARAACVTNDAGRSWMGYIHKPWSALCYDADDYEPPSAELVAGERVVESVDEDSTEAVEAVSSAIRFVNVPEDADERKTLDVWWNVAVKAGDLDGVAYFPAVRELFAAKFPDPDETEQIVLASMKGSSGVSVLRRSVTNEHGEVSREKYWHTNEIVMADSLPQIYSGGADAMDSTGAGWAPNAAHAYCEAGDGGYVCWALRYDMTTHSTLEHPLVYVKGEVTGDDGIAERKVWVYYVLPTNDAYPEFAARMLAGEQLPGPHPLDLMTDPWLPQIWWESPADPSRIVAHRDRKGAVWARRDGDLPIHMYYANRDEYAYVRKQTNGRPTKWEVDVPSGSPVPWNCVLNANEATNTATPGAWTWHVEWPSNTPVMKVGRTLTKAADGLAEVWGASSAAVLWPEPDTMDWSTWNSKNSVAQLVDPTVNRTASLASIPVARGKLTDALGFSCDPDGNCVYRDSIWYFRDVPASLSRRVWYDPNAAVDRCLVLQGQLDETTGGTSILYMNVLSKSERDALKKLVTNEYAEQWAAAVDSLAPASVCPSSHRYEYKTSQCGHSYSEFATKYEPIDHYALATLGGGGVLGATNWIVWIENDAAPSAGLGVDEGDAISMHVMRVEPDYHPGESVTRTDENNLLSQLLDVIYVEPFGGRPDEFYFEWQSAEPQANGTKPAEGDWRDAGRSGTGVTRFTLGTQGTLADLVNTYYRVRYRANPGTLAAETMGTAWSDWTEPCLAEGWIQRVINSITPFTQRVTDLYENPPDTTVSMLRQIGGPYRGDVALNMDNLSEVGLLETYMTLLNKAESMSISMGEDASIDKTGVNKQLMQLVERMDDFYALLGNEAYSDAANPTIGYGSGDTYGQICSGLFAFDNQVPTLLDEELSLLRGRGVIEDETAGTDVTAYQSAPCYNRLLWNFTRGITEGEVAYALNYDIHATGDETDVDAESAAAAYPQGHGDAWGHYLSGLKLWYRLLRNPSFSWSVSMGEMNVVDHAINVDYHEEQKMAEAAANLGKTAERIVDLTARKTWRDRAGAPSAADAGYEDKVPSRAFGYGEWGNKGGVSAFVNWVVVNSLMPAAETNETAYTDNGLLKINRSTCAELSELASRYSVIQRKVDRLNANLNPLGLADNAIPFGISTAAADGSESHFEQSLAAAKTALKNANALLERAGESSARLRQLAYDEAQAEQDAEEEEAEYEQRLISYYGYPYSGDIGVGCTYEQGYSGPDVYHWAYMDTDLTDEEKGIEKTVTVARSFEDVNGSPKTLTYDYSRAGLVIKPANVTGTRRAWGSLQYAYSEYLTAVSAFKTACDNYDSQKAATDRVIADVVKASAQFIADTVIDIALAQAEATSTRASGAFSGAVSLAQSEALLQSNVRVSSILASGLDSHTIYELASAGTFITGTETGTTCSRLMEYISTAFNEHETTDTTKLTTTMAELNAKGNAATAATAALLSMKTVNDVNNAVWSTWTTVQSLVDRMQSYCTQCNQQSATVISAFAAIEPAAEKVLTLKAEAEAIRNELETARKRRARATASSRYSDMAHRIWRDEALDVYSDSFDAAQRYAWLAAKAYDYETGGQITAGGETSEFLDSIVGARSLGELQDDGSPMRWGGSGDAGLSDALARLEENWTALKPRLGINNPQSEITWFSLRTEAFRILPGKDGLNVWRNKLDSFRVSSLKDQAAYKRLCQSVNADEMDEPAIVIPLGTTIEMAKNFFGLDLAGGDHQFSPTYFATKIAEVGVELVGYNESADGSKVSAFAETPYVYLVPSGRDVMRAPSTGVTLEFDVADQVLNAPNELGASSLDADWSEIYANVSGQTSGAVKVRRFPAFRANGESNASTLIGRSVWNTEWTLVIPAGSLRADRAKALEEFVWGNDSTPGVVDIKIGFRTYSHWGN